MVAFIAAAVSAHPAHFPNRWGKQAERKHISQLGGENINEDEEEKTNGVEKEELQVVGSTLVAPFKLSVASSFGWADADAAATLPVQNLLRRRIVRGTTSGECRRRCIQRLAQHFDSA